MAQLNSVLRRPGAAALCTVIVCGVGIPGTFVFAPGMPGVVSYVYSVDWGDIHTLAVGPDGRASFDYTPDTTGTHEIEVYSVTAGGSQSDYFYDFDVDVDVDG